MRNSFKSVAQVVAYEGRLVGQARKVTAQLEEVLTEQTRAIAENKKIEEEPVKEYEDPTIDLRVDCAKANLSTNLTLLTPLKIKDLVKQLGAISTKCQNHLTQLEMDGSRVIRARAKKGVNSHLAAFSAVAAERGLTTEGAPGVNDSAEDQLKLMQRLNKEASQALGKSRAAKR